MKPTTIRDNDFSLGTWISSGSPVVAELAGQFPFDWLLVDFEHGAASLAVLPEILRAVCRGNPAIIVRVPELNAAVIARVLDWGADGIMLPHVSSAQEAIDCVAAMRYPPVGRRGYSSTVRAYGYGMESPADPQEVKPLCFVQIEDVTGVQQADEIAAVDGVDILFVGPADLRLSLRHQPSTGAINFDDAVRRVAEAAKTHGKKAGMLLRDRNSLDDIRSIGYVCVAIDSDLGILRTGYKSLFEWFKQIEI